MRELDQEQETVVALSDRLSAVGAGHEHHVVLQATLNLLASAIVQACSTLDEAETAADQVGRRITTTVRRYWRVNHPH